MTISADACEIFSCISHFLYPYSRADNIHMGNRNTTNNHSTAIRNKGLKIAIAASFVLIILAAYRIPFIQSELDGTIIGVSGTHTGKGTEFIAIVHLDNGSQVMASMPGDLQIRTDATAKIIEMRTVFGRKSYTVTAYTD